MEASRSSTRPKIVDVMESKESYKAFYDRLGREYDESEFVHGRDPRRFNHVMGLLRPFAMKRLSLLDVGCNDGVYTIPYAELGGPATGIDVSPSLIERARQKARDLPVRFMVADVEELDASEAYDIVLMSETLEHVRNPEIALSSVVRAIKPGGRLLITTPSPFGINLVSTWRYFSTLLGGTKIVEGNVDSTDIGVLGEQHGLGGYAYRHDGYYLFAVKRWLERFGVRCERAYTAFHGNGHRLLSRSLRKLERRVPVHRIPGLNLFGDNDYLILRKPL